MANIIIEQQQQDPLIQAKQAEVAIKQAEVDRKREADTARLQLAAEKQRTQTELDKEKLSTERQLEGMKIGQKIASDLLDVEQDNKKQSAKDYKTGIDIAKDIVKDINKNE